MAAQCGCVGGQVYRKDQETGAGCKQGAVGGREGFRNTKKKRWKGDSGELGTGS